MKSLLDSHAVDMGTAVTISHTVQDGYSLAAHHFCQSLSSLTQPQSSTISPGQTATLSVSAIGSLTYQWYRGSASDTANPVGTNSASFTTPTLNTTTSYWVRVSNASWYVDSATATVTVPLVCPTFPYTVPAGNVTALINAIHCANSNGAGTNDVINLTNSIYSLSTVNSYNLYGDIYGNSGLPIIVDAAVGGSLTINGNGAVIERSSSTQFFRLLYVSTNADLTLDRITLRGGYLISSSGRGGAIYNAGAMRLSNSTIIQNASSTTSGGVNGTQGGGIYNEGTLTIDTTSILDNTVASFDSAISNQSAGGGIYNANIGTLTLTQSLIEGNVSNVAASSAGQGGGVANFGTLVVDFSTFRENTTSGYGGAIFSRDSTLEPDGITLRDSTFSGNNAAYAGALYLERTTATLERSRFENNTGTQQGGRCCDQF